MSGYLKITFGSMFSGKSSDLLRDIHEYVDVMNKIKGSTFKAVIINHSCDLRDISKAGILSSHSTCDKKPSELIEMIKTSKLEDVYEKLKEATYIGIDESQFFEDLVPYVKKLVLDGKYVHCSGLISDTNMDKFGNLPDLFPFADDIIQNKAFCMSCVEEKSYNRGMNASFNKWLGPISKDDKIVVGDKLYAPVCRKHF